VNERLAAQLQETLLVPRRRGLREILARGVASGQLAEAVQLDLAVDLVYGTMWYRLLSRHAPVDARLAVETADVLRICWRGRKLTGGARSLVVRCEA